MKYYLISELSKKTQLTTDTIRFYDKEGLIKAAYRAENSYRYYTDDTLKRLIFIKRCRALDMTLKEIVTLIQLEQDQQQDCHPVNVIIEQHLNDISNKINELNDLKRQLSNLRNSCRSSSTIDQCQILKYLENI